MRIVKKSACADEEKMRAFYGAHAIAFAEFFFFSIAQQRNTASTSAGAETIGARTGGESRH